MLKKIFNFHSQMLQIDFLGACKFISIGLGNLLLMKMKMFASC